MISEASFFAAAKTLNCSIAAVKAVSEVESKGAGFLADGKPLILFEPHIFWRELVMRDINPHDLMKGNEDILYQRWGSRPYGKYSEQHPKLERATQIHREAALSSCSWGKFQIMGFNFSLCRCESLQEFINAIYRSEDDHLRLFINFVLSKKLDGALRSRDWERFAKGYNGAAYKENNYHIKLKKAYEKYSPKS